MKFSKDYFTVVFKDLDDSKRKDLCYHENFSAGSWSHSIDDKNDLLFELEQIESALSDFEDENLEPDREVMVDALQRVRKVLKEHGRYPKPAKSFKDVLDDNYVGLL